MKIRVISLQHARARRARIDAQLAPLGVGYAFFDAIDSARADEEHFAAYDARRYLINTGRTPAAGEVGCYASHLLLWHLCVASAEPLVIMEDDAELSRPFRDAYRQTEPLIGTYGFIRLQTDGPNPRVKKVPLRRAGAFTLSYYTRYPYGSMCYAIAPDVAERFIAKSRILTGPVDFFIKNFWIHGQPLFSLSPHVVEGGPLRLRSTIGHRRKSPPTIGLQARRVLSKLEIAIRRERFNRAFFRDAQKLQMSPNDGVLGR